MGWIQSNDQFFLAYQDHMVFVDSSSPLKIFDLRQLKRYVEIDHSSAQSEVPFLSETKRILKPSLIGIDFAYRPQ